MRLALSTTTEEVAPGRPLVVVTQSGLALGERTFVPFDPHRERGIDPSFKTERRSKTNGDETADLIVTPLLALLEKARPSVASSGGLVVAVDIFAPYRAVVETLVTARQAGIGTVTLLATQENGAIAGTTVEVPATAPHLAPTGLVVSLLSSGIAVRTARGNLAPGCDMVGAGVAIPIVRGPKQDRHDHSALAACAARIRSEEMAHGEELRASVSATSSDEFRDVFRALDAIRPSFAKIQLQLPAPDHAAE
jgi:hypothetical protein